jgi:hypothetical protein
MCIRAFSRLRLNQDPHRTIYYMPQYFFHLDEGGSDARNLRADRFRHQAMRLQSEHAVVRGDRLSCHPATVTGLSRRFALQEP